MKRAFPIQAEKMEGRWNLLVNDKISWKGGMQCASILQSVTKSISPKELLGTYSIRDSILLDV